MRDAPEEQRARILKRTRRKTMTISDDIRALGISPDDLSNAAAVFYDANLSDDGKESQLESLADRADDDPQTRDECAEYLSALHMRRTARRTASSVRGRRLESWPHPRAS